MNNNIKYLIEAVQSFNVLDYDNEDDMQVQQNEIDNMLYKYFPKTTQELKDILIDLLNRDDHNSDKVINLNNIYTGNITDFSYLFYQLNPSKIDISDWDVSNGKYFRCMFYNCIHLDLVSGVDKWDVSNGVDFTKMFSNCKLVEGDFRNWDLSNALAMNEMFYNCRYILLEPEKYVKDGCAYFPKTNEDLKYLVKKFLKYNDKDLNIIDVSQVTDFNNIFSNQEGLYNIKIDKWNVSNGQNFRRMFYNCEDFTADLSNWNVSEGINFEQMFSGCCKFNSDISGWNVGKGRNFHAMFWRCESLDQNLFDWNMTSAEDIRDMFMHTHDDLKRPYLYGVKQTENYQEKVLWLNQKYQEMLRDEQ